MNALEKKKKLEETRMKMTGLQQLQAVIEEGLTPAIEKTLDFKLSELSFGKTVFSGYPGEKHLNPIGTVHGGYAATLLDSALGCAIHTVLEPGERYTTVDLNVKYLRAMLPGMGKVTASAEVVHKGRKIATAEARLVGEDGKLYATGNTTCAIY
ncbi:PaaI family thioesterase [Sneathiella litorea]|uniref:Hotdog fold thioesterase n=1 Tax=Sneathiella litorea TaxID=2606216 RepID=A0A6L8W815_9PROT|nr:PaaI family thioesterase [Sneathiella litorea]MZR31256.1 hotdog fold thioesterase [Sneathiella litorea]